jgi:hypothetical protein
MKKIITLALALAMVLALASCGAKSKLQNAVKDAISGDASGTTATPQPTSGGNAQGGSQGDSAGEDAPLARDNDASDTPLSRNDTPLSRDDGSGSGSTPSAGDAAGAVPDFGDAIGGTGNLSDYDTATKQTMIDSVTEDGGDLEFRVDGSVVYTDEDGATTVQNPDGTWTLETEDGGQFDYGSGDWPNNEFTELIPQPDMPVTLAGIKGGVFEAVMAGTAEQVKAYAEQVKAAGFTKDDETLDQEIVGMAMYSYTAKNAAGYKVEIVFTAGTSLVTVTKP